MAYKDHKEQAINGVENFLRRNRNAADERTNRTPSLKEMLEMEKEEQKAARNFVPEKVVAKPEPVRFGNLDLETAQANRKFIQEETIRKGKKCR